MREQVGLSEEECAEAAWLATPTGETYRGMAAISKTFDTLCHTGQLFFWIYRLPLLRQFYDWLYGWISRNRRHFSRLLNFFGGGVTAAIRQDPPWDPL